MAAERLQDNRGQGWVAQGDIEMYDTSVNCALVATWAITRGAPPDLFVSAILAKMQPCVRRSRGEARAEYVGRTAGTMIEATRTSTSREFPKQPY